MSGSLHGKVAVVSGGGRGLGRQIALGLGDAGADVVIDGPNEVLPVVEALVEVAFGQPCVATHRAHGERGSAFAAEQVHAGSDKIVPAQGVTVLQGDARPAAQSLTRLHFTPRIDSDNVCSQIADNRGNFQ